MSSRKLVTMVGASALIILVIVLLTLSTLDSNHAEEFGLFGEGNRRLPCWWKICMGEQYSQQVYQLITSDEQITDVSLDEHIAKLTFKLSNKDLTKQVWVDLHASGELFAVIRTSSAYELEVSQIIGKFGIPTSIGFSLSQNRSEGWFQLHYPQLGAVFTTQSVPFQGDGLELKKTLLLDRIALASTKQDYTMNPVYKLYSWQEWKGYALYKMSPE